MKSILLPKLFLLFFALPASTVAQTLDEGLKELSTQIVSEMSMGRKQKIAVVEFSDLDGKITEFGKFLSEELITMLFMSRKFEVVERQLLNKVLEEHRLNVSGLIDATTAKKLGNVLGVDAICSGTITDLVNSVKINSRLISTETGSIFAVASVGIQKDESIKKLMATISSPSTSDRTSLASQSSKPGAIFFKEDFSNVSVGMIPSGWLGGDKLIVKSDGRRKFLTDFAELGNHKITISNVRFPANFELIYTFQFGPQALDTHVFLYVGSINVTLDVHGWCVMNESRSDKFQDHHNKVVQVALKKENETFRLYVNGEEKILSRYPNFKTPTSFSMEFQNMSGFKLLELVGTSL